MTGIELLAGAAVGYLVRKLRRVGERADAEVDQALDAGLDAVHDLVARRLSGDPALEALEAQVETGDGAVGNRTLRRVSDAVADAAEADPEFARLLQQLVENLQQCEAPSGQAGTTVRQKATASGHGRVYQAGRDQTINEGSAE